MVLSDGDILRRLSDGTIGIAPLEDAVQQVQTCSVDLRLGNEFLTFRPSNVAFIEPGVTDPETYLTRQIIEEGGYLCIRPGEFILARTIEKLSVPDDLLARVDGRSSLGRIGLLVHATAGFIDPGFCGTITLELANVGPLRVKLTPGMRICQVSFEELLSHCERPYGPARGSKYQGQVGTTASRMEASRNRAEYAGQGESS